jgi:hypothetical protein
MKFIETLGRAILPLDKVDNELFFVHALTAYMEIMGPFSIITPTPALSFRNPGAASLSLWVRRQSTVEAAARFSEFDPHQARLASSGFGTVL